MAEAIICTEIAPGTGLYAVGPIIAGQIVYCYFLLQDASTSSPPLANISLSDSWNSPALTGWYIFAGELIGSSSAQAFANAARQNLVPLTQPTEQQSYRAVVWLSSTTDWSIFLPSMFLAPTNTLPPNVTRTLGPNPTSSVTFDFDPFQMQVTSQANFQLDATNGVLQITANIIAGGAVKILYNGTAQPQLGNYTTTQLSWFIQLPFAGLAAGSLCFGLGLNLAGLQEQFGCAFQYFWDDLGTPATLVYPLLLPAASTGITGFPGFNIRLNPIFPENLLVTSFDFDLDSSFTPYSANSRKLFFTTFFNTTTGGTVTLVPHDIFGSPAGSSSPVLGSPQAVNPLAAGFAFCRAPSAAGSPNAFQYYLAPKGGWRIAAATTSSGTLLPSGTPFEMMTGLFGKEYLQVEVGDLLEFMPGQAAYASGFGAGSPGTPDVGSAPLNSTYTTAWVQYAGNIGDGRGYFAQPSSSVYFGEVGGESYPTAVRALINNFSEPTPFPMVPYGGVFQLPSGFPPNNGVTLTQFESAAISSVRNSQLTANSKGPVFLPPEGSGAGTLMTAAVTPQGLLVDLYPDGTWSALTLANSAVNTSPQQSLVFTGNSGSPGISAVSPLLSNALLQNDLFLVISHPNGSIPAGGTLLGDFQNEINVGGFNFQLDIGPNATVLIFKFNPTASLAELAAQPSLWAESDKFVSDVTSTQGIILNAIEIAQESEKSPGTTGDPFRFFNTIAHWPQWTGVIALNCAINGNGIPPDFQMLLGGIQGQLRAHHFGLEMNRVTPIDGSLKIQQSSLFGVIHYDNPDPQSQSARSTKEHDIDYEVETLTVVFSNSAITQLAVQVGLTINKLLSRETALTPPASPSPNTLVIAGQYQKSGAIGTVTFSAQSPFLYTMPARSGEVRIVQQVQINQATLVPVSSAPSSPSGTAVVCEFAMSGNLWFNPDPFPAADGLDVFSYGISGSSPAGLAFSGMTVVISFELDAEGSMTPGSKLITFNPGNLNFTPASTAIRSGSLMSSLPLQYSRFVYSASGLTKSSTGASPVHVLQLEGGTKRIGSPGGGSPGVLPGPGSAPGINTKPLYALEYDLPLGSLGALSAEASIVAKLLLAWGPSPLVPDNDAVAVWVQLPSLSAGYKGFTLQGILQTVFGDANLLKVDLPNETVYAITFNNIQLSVFGYTFPPGLVVDFVLFAGTGGAARNTSNIAWFLSAYQT